MRAQEARCALRSRAKQNSCWLASEQHAEHDRLNTEVRFSKTTKNNNTSKLATMRTPLLLEQVDARA